MDPEKEIKMLEKELRRQRVQNIRLKLYMQILVGTPNCRTAQQILSKEAFFSEATINLN